jgi:hypothetical protein
VPPVGCATDSTRSQIFRAYRTDALFMDTNQIHNLPMAKLSKPGHLWMNTLPKDVTHQSVRSSRLETRSPGSDMQTTRRAHLNNRSIW